MADLGAAPFQMTVGRVGLLRVGTLQVDKLVPVISRGSVAGVTTDVQHGRETDRHGRLADPDQTPVVRW